MSRTKRFMASLLGVALLGTIFATPALAAKPAPASSCSFVANADGSLTLSATGLLARYSKPESKTTVVISKDGQQQSATTFKSDTYTATFTEPGTYRALFVDERFNTTKATCGPATIEEPVVPVTCALTPGNDGYAGAPSLRLTATGTEPGTTVSDYLDGSSTPVFGPYEWSGDAGFLTYDQPGDHLSVFTNAAGDEVCSASGTIAANSARLYLDGTSLTLNATGLPANTYVLYSVSRNGSPYKAALIQTDEYGNFRVVITDPFTDPAGDAQPGTYTGYVELGSLYITLDPFTIEGTSVVGPSATCVITHYRSLSTVSFRAFGLGADTPSTIVVTQNGGTFEYGSTTSDTFGPQYFRGAGVYTITVTDDTTGQEQCSATYTYL